MTTARSIVLALVLAACGSPEVARKPAVTVPPVVTDDTSPIGRLDARAVPVGYELALDLDPAAEGYTGEVAITVDVARPLRVIWLHGRDLVIDRATVTAADGTTQAARVIADARTEHTEGQGQLLGIGVERPIAGRAVVRLAYHAAYRAKEGLIRAPTQNKLVYTDLEPTDARTLMPCFDDPRFKVPWTVTVTAPEGLGVYANYPEQQRTKLDGRRVRVSFQRTRPLPTYLVAIAVGELEEVQVKSDVPIRLLLPGKNLAPYAATIRDAIPPLLAELVRVFDDPVPYPKLDMLVVPMDPGRGGMENPGLTTLGAHMVLVDPALTGSRARKQLEDAVHVIAHELAHLWIGDLMTIGSWSELWLQEGGATWFGIRAARTHLGASWIPPFNRDVIDTRLRNGARPPIRKAIAKLEDAGAMFRTETYAGGAAVFDALEAWLGEAAITGAFADLIDRRRDGTMSTDDFVAAVRGRAPAAGADVADSVAAMLDATRMPAVTATVACGATVPSRVTLTADTPQPVPVCFDHDRGPRACTVVRDGRAVVEVPGACPTWVLTNPGGGAPYLRTWAPGALFNVISSASLSGRDAAALLSELRTLLVRSALAGLSRDDQIAAAAWLAAEPAASPMVVSAAVAHLDALELTAPNAANRAGVFERVAQVLAWSKRMTNVAFLTFEGPSPTAPLATWLARRGHKLARHLAATTVNPASMTVMDVVAAAAAEQIIEPALLAHAASGTPAQFRALRAKVLAAPRPRAEALRALASFQFPRAGRELRALVTNRKLTARDAEVVLLAAIHNPVLRGELTAIARARTDLSDSVRAQLARSLCEGALAPRCTAAREAWGQP
ncbi:MAG TPA: M1 family metallopeptidase [Kofleriaceae bacterium]|nr:M1 family metallopeptidase [Kofleriaceae bacterium]